MNFQFGRRVIFDIINTMSNKKTPLNFSASPSIKSTCEEEWNSLFGGDIIEGWGYHKNFEEAGVREFSLGYLLARRDQKLAAILPFFTVDFSFATIIQGPLQRLILKIQKHFTSFMRIKLLFVGFPTTEELYLGISRQEDLRSVLEGSLKEFYEIMKKEKISTILFYNLSGKHSALGEYLRQRGFARMENFPNTKITIRAASLEEYINMLSKNTRKDLRRKLKKSSRLAQLHTEVITDISPIRNRIYELYLNNLGDSDVSFETLTPDFFQKIPENMPGSVKFFITRDKEKIVAFNLCLVKGDTCIDKFIGFDQALARKYHLYYFTFCHNLDWCIKNGFRFYQMGITDYHPKLRLGAELIPLHIYFRRLNPITNLFGKLIARIIQPANFDPTLRKIKKEARKP